MSGPPLGRKPQNVSVEDKKQALADEAIRNTVEGKFGQVCQHISRPDFTHVFGDEPRTGPAAVLFVDSICMSLLGGSVARSDWLPQSMAITDPRLGDTTFNPTAADTH